MNCPHCNSPDTGVTETRKLDGEIWRKRRCKEAECGKKFVTRETTRERTKLLTWPSALTDIEQARFQKLKDAKQVETLDNIWERATARG
jgi:transcriptional regulator NrdR family protein